MARLLAAVFNWLLFKQHPYDSFQVHAKLHTMLIPTLPEDGSMHYWMAETKKYISAFRAAIKKYVGYKDGNGNTISSLFREYNYSTDAGYKPGQNQEVLVSLHRNYGRYINSHHFPWMKLWAIQC
jgi:hypothetical protein